MANEISKPETTITLESARITCPKLVFDDASGPVGPVSCVVVDSAALIAHGVDTNLGNISDGKTTSGFTINGCILQVIQFGMTTSGDALKCWIDAAVAASFNIYLFEGAAIGSAALVDSNIGVPADFDNGSGSATNVEDTTSSTNQFFYVITGNDDSMVGAVTAAIHYIDSSPASCTVVDSSALAAHGSSDIDLGTIPSDNKETQAFTLAGCTMTVIEFELPFSSGNLTCWIDAATSATSFNIYLFKGSSIASTTLVDSNIAVPVDFNNSSGAATRVSEDPVPFPLDTYFLVITGNDSGQTGSVTAGIEYQGPP